MASSKSARLLGTRASAPTGNYSTDNHGCRRHGPRISARQGDLVDSGNQCPSSIRRFQAEGCQPANCGNGAQHERARSELLARRTSKLLTLWINNGSTTQVECTLNNDTEAYDLAYQASYALPKILIWAVPVLGFIGTVLGIGKAIGSFEEFISQVEDIDVLRDGLIKVTEGLGTAFDTTFLALTVSLMVMIPLTLIERLEQRLLTKIDLDLKDQILEALPEAGGVDEATLQKTISTALTTHLPNPDVLVEPARMYAEKAAQHLVENLQPLHKIADEAIAGIESARINTKESAEAIHDALSRGAKRIGDSVDALQPLLDQLNKVSSLSEDLGSELAQLQSGTRLRKSLSELDSTLNLLKGTLREVSRPRKIMLVEENQ